MLTEDEARDLLTKAARTIQVEAAEPATLVPARRPWPYFIAAVAVLIVVTGVALAAQRVDERDPANPVTPSVTPPRVDFQQFSTELAPDQIPSVFGYDAQAAQAMLEKLGLDVYLKENIYVCETPGRALETDPPVGTKFAAGDPVTLMVASANPVGYCPGNGGYWFAWRLLDFANGRGPAPAFADRVLVSANGTSAMFSGSELVDPTAWVDGTALGVLREQSREVVEQGSDFRTPWMQVRPSRLSPRCHSFDLPDKADPATGVGISIGIPIDGAPFGCTVVDVFRGDGEITAIVLRTDSTATGSPSNAVPVPDVVGLSAEGARSAIEAAGLAYEEHIAVRFPGHFCMRDYQVVSQDPAAGQSVLPGVRVQVETAWVGCDGTVNLPWGNPEAIADAFIRFASSPVDSGQGLLIENPVRLYLGNQFIRTVAGEDARDPANWDVCSEGYAERSCPMSATAELADGVDAQVWSTAPSESVCSPLSPSPPDDTGGVLEVAITPKSTSSCMDFYEVQLFTDGGVIVAVNLLLGGP